MMLWSLSHAKIYLQNRFDPRPVRVGLVLEKVALGEIFIHVLCLSRLNNFPSMLHTNTDNAVIILNIATFIK